MSRLVVVSPSPGMGMALQADHVVDVLRPPEWPEWQAVNRNPPDAVILQLDSPQLAADAVRELRSTDPHVPVLLVANAKPGWNEIETNRLGSTRLMPLPVTRDTLHAAVTDLLTLATTVVAPVADEPPESTETSESAQYQPAQPPGPREPLLDRPVSQDVLGDLTSVGADPAERRDKGEDETTFLGRQSRLEGLATTAFQAPPAPPEPAAPDQVSEEELARLLSDAVSRADNRPVTAPRPPPPPSAPAAKPTSPPAHARSGPNEQSAPERAPGWVERRRAERRQGDRRQPQHLRPEYATGRGQVLELVRALVERTQELNSVPDVAAAIVADAVDRAGATAGAIMVPDGDLWRVEGGVGLRSLERRYEIDADHWLISDIVSRGRGVIVEDTDMARERLHGAPLTYCRHIMVAPVPGVQAVLVLGRPVDPPFTDNELRPLASLGFEATPVLTAAYEVRALARLLSDFRHERA